MNFEERPRKIHLFHDWRGETYKSMGSTRRYANTLCKGNFDSPELVTTLDPAKVTCRSCLKKIPRPRIEREEGDRRSFGVDSPLNREMHLSDVLAETIAFAIGHCPDQMVRDVLSGAMARHKLHRESAT